MFGIWQRRPDPSDGLRICCRSGAAEALSSRRAYIWHWRPAADWQQVRQRRPAGTRPPRAPPFARSVAGVARERLPGAALRLPRPCRRRRRSASARRVVGPAPAARPVNAPSARARRRRATRAHARRRRARNAIAQLRGHVPAVRPARARRARRNRRSRRAPAARNAIAKAVAPVHASPPASADRPHVACGSASIVSKIHTPSRCEGAQSVATPNARGCLGATASLLHAPARSLRLYLPP
ncbi:hypothetical protein PBRA_008135 [Plasmodiophora brassicae]|uniref:Uncharacterized protein n=1 Tax=Plasmodiophora brassicae TaxID=37360 RepID=A0A0G4IZP2_PLABS|nr:hypothetical protein PBRA_008135 [Plasmodiophora brassicae]